MKLCLHEFQVYARSLLVSPFLSTEDRKKRIEILLSLGICVGKKHYFRLSPLKQ